jgi:hypothetical protein
MNESLEHRAAGNVHVACSEPRLSKESNMKIGASSVSLHCDRTLLAKLIARRWKQDRPYFTLNERSREAWLEASWGPQSVRSAFELHWSRCPSHCACRPASTSPGSV